MGWLSFVWSLNNIHLVAITEDFFDGAREKRATTHYTQKTLFFLHWIANAVAIAHVSCNTTNRTYKMDSRNGMNQDAFNVVVDFFFFFSFLLISWLGFWRVDKRAILGSFFFLLTLFFICIIVDGSFGRFEIPLSIRCVEYLYRIPNNCMAYYRKNGIRLFRIFAQNDNCMTMFCVLYKIFYL